MVTPEGAKDHSRPLGMSSHEMSQHRCGFVSGPVGGASAACARPHELAPGLACCEVHVTNGGVSQRAKEWGVF